MESGPAVAIYGQLLKGSAGGIETNLLKLLAALAVENKPDDRQLVIGPGGESSWFYPYLASGQKVLEWPPLRCEMPVTGWKNLSRAIPRLLKDTTRKLLRRERLSAYSESASALTKKLKHAGIDVVHFPYQRYFPTNLPFIFEPWDLQHIHLPELFSKSELEFRNWLYRQACEEATLVVTATRWTKADLMQHFGLPADKIAVIPRGAETINSEVMEKNVEVTLGKLGLPQRFALYPAKTWAHKNHKRLFEALACLREQHGIVVPLVCTGKPVYATMEDIQETVETLKLSNQVFFTGFLDEASVRQLYARADLMVFPSLFEGLGIPVLEAMALGTPVVSSCASCLPEIGGNAAVFFDPYSVEDMVDKIALVWQDSALRMNLKRYGYANIASFGWAEAARSFRVVYKHVANMPLDDQEAKVMEKMLS